MSKLLKPIEYANELGISRQAVYAKIKKGLLDSKTINGKIYIILEQESDIALEIESEKEILNRHHIDVKELLNSKEETIAILKENISDLKHTNTEINTTLRGEIELLKQVFSEMRNLYVKQVDYMSFRKHLELETKEDLQIEQDREDACWITIDEFFERSNITKEKKKRKILKRLERAYLIDDRRVRKENGDIFVSCYHFYEDILKKKI